MFLFGDNKMEEIILKLGAVVMLIGGIVFGVGWSSKNKERKARGISIILAGVIVTLLFGIIAL